MPWLVFEMALAGLAWMSMGVFLATVTAVVAVQLGLVPRRMRGRATIAALLGGAVIAAALHRFGLEGPLALDIGGRPFPTPSVLVGAVVGVVVVAGLSRRRPAAYPSGDEAPV